MSVRELSKDELDELKSSYFFQLLDSGEIEDVCPGIEFYFQIPDDIVYEHYEGVNFVKEDFFCNIVKD